MHHVVSWSQRKRAREKDGERKAGEGSVNDVMLVGKVRWRKERNVKDMARGIIRLKGLSKK